MINEWVLDSQMTAPVALCVCVDAPAEQTIFCRYVYVLNTIFPFMTTKHGQQPFSIGIHS